MARTTFDTWAEALPPQQGAPAEDMPDLMGVVPWDKASPEQARKQMQMLQALHAHYTGEMQRYGPFTQEQLDYLDTPLEDMAPEWQQLSMALGNTLARIDTVEAQLAQGRTAWPELEQAVPSAPGTTGIEGAPGAPGTTPGTGVSPGQMDPMEWVWATMSDEERENYKGLVMQGYQTESQLNQLVLQNQQKAWEQAHGPLGQFQNMLEMQDYMRDRTALKDARKLAKADSAFQRPFEQAYTALGFQDYLGDRRWTTQQRKMAVEQQQAALAHQAWTRAHAGRQLGAQVGHNIGGLEQNAWQFMAQNALPQGIGHVPGFEPDSRLAGFMGPSFQGLPTVSLQTPDPRGPYAWAAQYARGG